MFLYICIYSFQAEAISDAALAVVMLVAWDQDVDFDEKAPAKRGPGLVLYILEELYSYIMLYIYLFFGLRCLISIDLSSFVSYEIRLYVSMQYCML